MINVRQLNDLPVGQGLKSGGGYVYIGRPSIFGNPYVIGIDGNRREVLQRFAHYFLVKLKNEPQFRKEVLALRGKVLGCFCKPRLCHGDIIARWLASHA